MSPIHNLQELSLDQLATDLGQLRLLRPELVKSMEHSLTQFGQLTPIVVRQGKSGFQIIDGFKRYHAAVQLNWCRLQANILTVSRRAATALILTYNKDNHSLLDYEEALVLLSLKKDYQMPQEEIAKLVGRSASWVSRRLALVEKLAPGVIDEVKLDALAISQAREIVKLPQGNQLEVTASIIQHDLTTRQSAVVIAEFLKTTDREQQQYILAHPLEIIQRVHQENDGDGDNDYDCRLNIAGNRLFKTIRLATRQLNRLVGEVDRSYRGLTDLEKSIIDPELQYVKKIASELMQLISWRRNDER